VNTQGVEAYAADLGLAREPGEDNVALHRRCKAASAQRMLERFKGWNTVTKPAAVAEASSAPTAAMSAQASADWLQRTMAEEAWKMLYPGIAAPVEYGAVVPAPRGYLSVGADGLTLVTVRPAPAAPPPPTHAHPFPARALRPGRQVVGLRVLGDGA